MPEKNRKPVAKTPFFARLWQLLSSPRLTLFIILVLVAICLIGVFLIQVPSEIASDPANYQAWVEQIARPRFGAWTGFFSALRFFDVFHSPWFLAAGSLLMLNILFCTVKRWNAVIGAVRGGGIVQAAAFYRAGTDRAESKVAAPPAQVGKSVTGTLQKRRYSAKSETSGGAVHIVALKNRFSPAGTFLTHLSLILFVLGFLVTAFWGFRHTAFVLAEGAQAEVGHDTGLSLELISFEDEYYPDGMPKDYRSSVVLYKNGQEVAAALVRVNSPLSYHGVNFYQAGFGPAVRIHVHDASVGALYHGAVPLTQPLADEAVVRYAGQLDLPAVGMTVMLLNTAIGGNDSVIGEDQVGLLVYRSGVSDPVAFELLDAGVPLEVEGLEFTYGGQAQYSVFQITRSPGLFLVWMACAFIILGLSLVFYLPYRQLWAFVEPMDGGRSRVIIRAAGRSSPGLNEIKSLLQQVGGRQ